METTCTMRAIRFGARPICASALAASVWLCAVPGSAGPVGKATCVKPKLRVESGSSNAEVKAKGSRTLYFGDKVALEGSGEAKFVYSDDARHSARAPTRFVISRPDTPDASAVIDLVGALSRIVVENGGRTRVRSSAATAAARGTVFTFETPTDATAVVTVVEGTVEFFNAQGSVVVGPGHRSEARVGSAPTPPVAVDTSGLIVWIADAAALPVEYEMPSAGDAGFASSAQEPLRTALRQIARRDYEAARAALTPIAATPDGLAVAGLIELREGRTDAAAATLRLAAERAPGRHQPHALLALARLQLSDLPSSVASARRAVELAPRSALSRGALATALFFAGRSQEALREAGRAVRLSPDSPFARLCEGRALLAQQRPGEALLAFRQAAALAPDLAVMHAEVGAALLRLRRPAEAEAAYRRALALAPAFTEAHTGLGMALQRLSKGDEASRSYRTALDLRPGDPSARQALASLLTEQGDLAGAERVLDLPGAPAPDRAMALVRLSELALIRRSDLHAAETYARRAVALLPSSAVARYQLGRVYLEQGRPIHAEQSFRLALMLDRSFADARYALGMVRSRADTGLRSAPALFAMDTGGLARLVELMDLETAGLSDRVQAATADPDVVRRTTQAYGAAQLDVLAGNQNSCDISLSHLSDSSSDGGVAAIGLAHSGTDGFRTNGDRETQRMTLMAGTRATGSRLGTFVLGQFSSRVRGLNGLDIGGFPDTDLMADDQGWRNAPGLGLTARERTNSPTLIAALTYEPDDRLRGRLLGYAGRPRMSMVGLQEGSTVGQYMDNRGVEGRLDLSLGPAHRVAAGFAVGTSAFRQRQDVPDLFLVASDVRSRVFEAYVRHDADLGPRLALTGEVQYRRGRSAAHYAWYDVADLGGPPVSEFTDLAARGVWRGALIASYRPDRSSELRLRARGLFGGIPEFRLLSPTDDFADLGPGMPDLAIAATGDAYDLEYARMLGGSAMFRAGVAYRQLRNARDTLEQPYDRARALNPRFVIEGALDGRTTLYCAASFNHVLVDAAEATAFMPDTPRWSGEIGLSHFGPSGWFVSPTLRLRSGMPPYMAEVPVGGELQTVERRLPGFGVLDLRLGRRFGLRGVVFIEVLNVLDKQYDLYRSGLTQSGRTWRAGANARF